MPIPRTLGSLTLLLAALSAASAATPTRLAVQQPGHKAVAAPGHAAGRGHKANAAPAGSHDDGADGLGGTYSGGGNDVP